MRMMMAMTVTIVLATLASGTCFAQALTDVVAVTEFRALALDVGGEQEDWQPAFQAAIARARETRQSVYVPAGTYRIRQAIEIVPPPRGEKNPFGADNVRLIGAGAYKSVIKQEVETENCINWTGLTYEESAKNGQISHLSLRGGAIGLNIKWHNHFEMDSCYIEAALEYGVYAEGWSSRFTNSTIRWCKKAGFYGGAHFNNCVIRDCYFSRDGIGILLTGVHGSRIEGCGLESCATAAVFVRSTRGLTINNSYFEGNGYKTLDVLPVEGSANTIHLDMNNMGIKIHDNILRVNMDPEGGMLSIADCNGGHIYDNLFYCYSPAQYGIRLRPGADTRDDWDTIISGLIVENNQFHNVAVPLSETAPGVHAEALANGCTFDLPLSDQ